MTDFVLSRGTPTQLLRLLQRIGYLDDPDYVDDTAELGGLRPRHALEVAFNSIGISGALCPRSSLATGPTRAVPVVYVAWARDEADADRKHRAIWSQSIVPVIIMADESGIQVRNGFDYRASGERTPWSALEADALPRSLVSLTADAIRSSASWSDFAISNRVDTRIATDIRNLSDKVRRDHPELRERQDLITALIGRLLYLYVLVDRRVIDQEWLDRQRMRSGRLLCPDINLDEGHGDGRPCVTIWPANQVWRLFDAIDSFLNGSIFPIAHKDRSLVDLAVVHLVRRALRADEVDETGQQQFSFLDVDYSTLRTETISAIYECFFDLEGKSQRKEHGAFYTPAFVVDYMLDEIDQLRPLNEGSLVADPACGSGAFLVSAFRHIVEHSLRDNRRPTPEILRRILLECIHGTELKKQAANVARFSLYLTILDYLPGIRLTDLPRGPKYVQLFPDLSKNIVEGDAFAPRRHRRRATHVVGNPPWTSFDEESHAATYAEGLPRRMDGPVIDAKSLAELFYWLAVNDLSAPDGVIAFVLPTKALIAPAARSFPAAVAEHTTIRGITNLSHFRRKLFSGAGEAATILFVEPRHPDPLAWGWRYAPKLSSQPVAADGTPWAILVDRGQVERFRQQELLLDGHEWYRDLMLQPLDRRLASALDVKADNRLDVEAFFRRSGMHVTSGDSPARARVPAHLLLSTSGLTDYRLLLGLTDKDRLDLEEQGLHGSYELPNEIYNALPERQQRIFGGPLMLLPRSQAAFYVVNRNAAYNSSFQGIHFIGDDINTSADRLAVLDEFGRYLKTKVARYLLSLFGRQWVVDQRRFETPDLKRLPIPYRDWKDLLKHPVSTFSEDDFIDFARERLEMPRLFADAVREHATLREPFQNGKRDAVASQPVDVSTLERYTATLRNELIQLLVGTPIDVRIYKSRTHSREIGVVLAPDPSRIHDAPSNALPRLGDEGTFSLEEHGDHAVARIVKPDAITAWTAERAYADAVGIARSVMAG
jgi:hypothetical protein